MHARSYLFVPADRAERFDKALASGADRVVIDLEDAVAPEHKALGRAAFAARLARATAAERARLVVRINDEHSAWFDDDLALLRELRPAEVMVPKAERADSLARLRAACPGIAVLALVESARGVVEAERVARQIHVEREVDAAEDQPLHALGRGQRLGSEHAAREKGLLRMEGKDYVVQDGDCMHFRFNVTT